MSHLPVSQLQPGRIYREVLSGLRVRVQYLYSDGRRAVATYFSEVLGTHLAIDVKDGDLEITEQTTQTQHP